MKYQDWKSGRLNQIMMRFKNVFVFLHNWGKIGPSLITKKQNKNKQQKGIRVDDEIPASIWSSRDIRWNK